MEGLRTLSVVYADRKVDREIGGVHSGLNNCSFGLLPAIHSTQWVRVDRVTTLFN